MQTLFKTIDMFVSINDEVIKIRAIVVVNLNPSYNYQFVWKTELYRVEGKITSLIVKDGKYEYECVTKKFKISDGETVTIEWPNELFFKLAKPTNIIGIEFCLDEIPKNLDLKIRNCFMELPISHFRLVFQKQAYVLEEEIDE
jgi:hypothetical protein